jgi:hypothetical protein
MLHSNALLLFALLPSALLLPSLEALHPSLSPTLTPTHHRRVRNPQPDLFQLRSPNPNLRNHHLPDLPQLLLRLHNPIPSSLVRRHHNERHSKQPSLHLLPDLLETLSLTQVPIQTRNPTLLLKAPSRLLALDPLLRSSSRRQVRSQDALLPRDSSLLPLVLLLQRAPHKCRRKPQWDHSWVNNPKDRLLTRESPCEGKQPLSNSPEP